MNFKSDNVFGVSEQIMQALIQANTGTDGSYGTDTLTQELTKRVAEIFEHDVTLYFTNTGTASNSLAVSSLVSPGGALYCHKTAHLITDECGAPEFFSNGSVLISIDGVNGKIDCLQLESHINHVLTMRPHASKPSAISVTQSTEWGTIYTLDELAEIQKYAQKYNLALHMDGARFANALVSLGCSPAQMTWKSGIDVLSFGATKNGALCAEMIVFFNQKYAHDFDYRHKQAGQLMSKTRFFAAQFLAYFENDLWLSNARHANAMAQKLKQIFETHVPGNCVCPVQANEIFINLQEFLVKKLYAHGAQFYNWGGDTYRFVTSCATQEQDINMLGEFLKREL